MPLTKAASAERIKRLRSWLVLPLVAESEPSPEPSHRQVIALAVLIFLIACGVRLLLWQDLRRQIDSGQMHFGLTKYYKEDAKNLVSGRLDLFVKGPAPPSDAIIITHPPGYSLLLAPIFWLFGDSNTVLRFVQILLDGLTVVGIFFIARELLPLGVATISGLIVAISPQLSFNSLVLLPDALCVLPTVWAVFLLIRAYKRPRLLLIVGVGVLIGVSSWLRANSLLLSPFLAFFVLLLFKRGQRLRYALFLVAATIIVIAPITIRNLVVFNQLIPLSLGVGLNLTEGIADYDDEKRFGLMQKDHEVNQWEAEFYKRPDYVRSVYAPDGIERERARLKQGLAVVKSHPLWFGTVMCRRMGFMMTSGPAPIISPIPAMTHSLATTSGLESVWTSSPAQILDSAPATASVEALALSQNELRVVLKSNGHDDALLIQLPPVPLNAGRDYVLQFPMEIMQGRITVRIMDPERRKLLASIAVPDVFQGFPAEKPPSNVVQIPFISAGHRKMQISILNGDKDRAEAQIGRLELYELGASSYGWTRYPRLILRFLQKRFTTQQMLPLTLGGVLLLIIASRWHSLAILLAVPLYYLLAQSPLHTEYRYVLAIHYFFSVLTALSLYWLTVKLYQFISRLRRRQTDSPS